MKIAEITRFSKPDSSFTWCIERAPTSALSFPPSPLPAFESANRDVDQCENFSSGHQTPREIVAGRKSQKIIARAAIPRLSSLLALLSDRKWQFRRGRSWRTESTSCYLPYKNPVHNIFFSLRRVRARNEKREFLLFSLLRRSFLRNFYLREIFQEANRASNILFAIALHSSRRIAWMASHTRWVRRAIGVSRGGTRVAPFAMTKWSRQNCRVQPGGDNGASNERNRGITPRTIIEFRRAVVTRP